jgi:hypothetical protein
VRRARRLLLAGALAALAAARPAGPDERAADGRQPVIVQLTNQSWRHPLVRLAIEVDGAEVARRWLFVGLQHTRREIRLAVPPGPHRIAAVEPGSGLRAERHVDVDGPRWVLAGYWHQTGRPPEVTLDVQAFPFGVD